jgi:hypothetical protein
MQFLNLRKISNGEKCREKKERAFSQVRENLAGHNSNNNMNVIKVTDNKVTKTVIAKRSHVSSNYKEERIIKLKSRGNVKFNQLAASKKA